MRFRPKALVAIAIIAVAAADPIAAAEFGAPVEATPPVRVSPPGITSGERFPSITSLADGGFVIVWNRLLASGTTYDIVGRRYDAAGQPAGAEFIVEQAVEAPDEPPLAKVAGLSDGRFVVTWAHPGTCTTGTGQTRTTRDIVLRRYSATGARGARVLVQAGSDQCDGGPFYYESGQPSIAPLVNGRFVITWGAIVQTAAGTESFRRQSGRVYPANLQAGLAFDVADNVGRIGKVVRRGSSAFVVAYAADGGSEMFFQRYSSTGAPVGNAQRITQTTGGENRIVDLASLTDGSFVATWRRLVEEGDVTLFNLLTRTFSPIGTPLSDEISVSQAPPGGVGSHLIASHPDGGYVSTWLEEKPDETVDFKAQRFSITGTPIGPQFRILPDVVGQRNAVATLSGGAIVFVLGEDVVNFQMFRSAGAPIARPDTAATDSSTTITIDALANDADPDVGDTLMITSAAAVSGVLTINPDNTLRYRPRFCAASDVVTYTIQDQAGLQSTATVNVAITPVPRMRVEPTTPAAFQGPVGGPFGPAISYSVRNVGCAPLEWSSTRATSPAWVFARSPISGTLPPAGIETVNVSVPANPNVGLSAGTYSGTLRFVATSGKPRAATVDVSLTVTAP